MVWLGGFFDYDNDGLLDLFVTRYMEWDARHSKICGGAGRRTARLVNFPATTNLLYRNRGDGTFEDVSEDPGLPPRRGEPWAFLLRTTMTTGSLTFLSSNDGMQQYLFHNNGEWHF